MRDVGSINRCGILTWRLKAFNLRGPETIID